MRSGKAAPARETLFVENRGAHDAELDGVIVR